MNCKISVVMSVYNAEKYVKEAIDSILNQTFTDFEFIIINDGSTDRSLEIIESIKDRRIVLINQSNSGLAKALNVGIQQSKSNIIARMDADDISFPNRLDKQYNFLLNNPEYIIVGSKAMVIDKNGNYVCTPSILISDTETKNWLPSSPFIHPSVMLRKESIFKAGLYCESMIKSQDTVLFNRMASYGKFYNIPESLLKYRIVPTANSSRNKKTEKIGMKIIKYAIEHNNISDADKSFLQSTTDDRYHISRLGYYHTYLARRYLYDNNQPKLVRKNIYSAIKYNKSDPFLLVLFILSFMPFSFVKKINNRNRIK